MVKVPWAQKIPTTFYDVDEGEIHHYEAGPALLPNGAGIVFEGGGRFRVVDTWLSLDRHGRFDIGYYVFLKRVDDTADDRLGKLAPDYYSD
jgi:hypothetical protein